jgi:tetratricopeptide (TPR) repeat protein
MFRPWRWRPPAAALCLAWLVGTTFAQAPRDRSPDEYLQRALSRRSRQDFERALADLNQVVARAPQNHEGYYYRGLVRRELNLPYQDRIADFTQAIALDSKHADAYFYRGNVRGQLGYYLSAFEDRNAAIELNPRNARYLYERGISQGNLGWLGLAIADLAKGIMLDPSDVAFYNWRGWFHAKQSDHAAAGEKSAAASGDPRPAPPLAPRGQAIIKASMARVKAGLRRGDDLESANKIIERMIALYPNHPEVILWQGMLLLKSGKPNEAQALFEKCLQLDPSLKDILQQEASRIQGK